MGDILRVTGSTSLYIGSSAFEINRTESPPSCLPADLDKTNLIDATRVSDEWRRYYDTETGELHDGAAYYKQAQKQAGFP